MPHGISRHGEQVGMLNNAMVVIMGDVEGNPRMCYHALSLADNGYSVDLIGYAGTEPHNRILTHPKIRLIHMRPTPDAILRFFPSPIALLTKYLWILFFLFITLLFHTKDCVKLTITQNPPGAIAMFICWMAAKLKHSALIIDWNNYSSTLLLESDVNEIKQSAGKGLFASMGEVAEKCFGKTADWNLCASRTIQKGLRRRLGIKTFTTVYNKVPSWGYRSLNTEEKHIFLARMMKTPDFTHVTASKHWPTNEDGSLFFHKTPCGKMELLDNRPLLIVIPTCLTLSEDCGSLLEALEGYEKRARSDIRQSADETKSLPKLLVAIIGKGSLKNFYLERIAKMDMQYVHIVITWLTAEDYPQFLACADLGVSLRTSSPGVDLSMKVADMIGCHLPVLAKKNDAIGELVVDSINGMFFDNLHELKQQLIELATGFPKFSQALNKIKDNRKSQPQSTWEEEWNAAVMPLIRALPEFHFQKIHIVYSLARMEENFNKSLIAISILVTLILVCDGTKIECSKDSPTINDPAFKDTPFPRPEQVKLGDNYEISLRYTNWITSETAKFTEQSVNGSTVISKTTQKSVTTLYRGIDRKLYVETNMTHDTAGQTCTGAPTESQMNIYDLSPTFAKFLNGSNSFVSMLESIISDRHQFNRTFLDNTTNITAGVETVSWVGCARAVSNTTNNVQIDVYFAGDKTLQQPYNGNFHNPQVMAIHMQVFQEEPSKDNTTKINVIEHISFDLVTLDTVDPMQKDTILTPPRGLFCSGLPKVECPHDLSSRFVAKMEYIDSVNNAKDDIEVLYDESEHIFSISMDFQPNSDVPLLGNTFLAGPTKVIHDFNYGLQYVLSRDGSVCQGVEPIDSKMGDVGKGPNGTLTMRSAAEMLFNLTGLEFYYAGKVRAEENNMLLVSYVTRKMDSSGNEVVVEMLYREVAWSANGPQKPQLHCIMQYHRNKTGEIVRRSTIRMNALINNNEAVSTLDYGVFQCLRNYDGNRMFFLSLQNVAMEDISKAGFTRVKSALAKTIAHSANVSVLRLSNLMFTQQGSEMLACFMIGEKSDVKSPAKTAYFHEELSVDAARRALNRTVATGGLTVKIPAISPKQPALSFTSNKFGLLPNHNTPSPPPAYIGYSGQAMFVMAVFMFTFGATLVIGSYVFYVKRQSIRGMAYQVFE